MAIHETVKRISDAIQKDHLSFDAESRTLVTTGNPMETVLGLVKEHEGIDLTPKAIKDTFEVLNLYTAGSGLATGELAIGQMKKDKDLETLSAKFDVTKQVDITHTVHRSFDATPIAAKGTEVTPVTKHGRLDSKLDVRGVKAKSNATVRNVRDYLYEIGEKKLAK